MGCAWRRAVLALRRRRLLRRHQELLSGLTNTAFPVKRSAATIEDLSARQESIRLRKSDGFMISRPRNPFKAICVKNRPHRRDLRDRRALRTSDMAFEMSAGVIPASFAWRLDSAQASSNSAASSVSVGILMGCMITAPLYARIVNDVPLCQPYIWRKASGRTTCPFEDSLVVITFVMSNLSCAKTKVLYHNSYQ